MLKKMNRQKQLQQPRSFQRYMTPRWKWRLGFDWGSRDKDKDMNIQDSCKDIEAVDRLAVVVGVDLVVVSLVVEHLADESVGFVVDRPRLAEC